MALETPFTNRHTKELETLYQYIDLFQTRFSAQQLRIDTLDFQGKQGFEVNGDPVKGTSFVLPQEGLPALDADKRPLFKRENGTYVLREEKDNPDAETVTPTWAEVPPMMEFLLGIVAPPGGIPEGTPIFYFLMNWFYNFLPTRPEFAEAKVVDL